MNNKVLVGGLIGFVVYFLLGFLIWGVLLKNTMGEHMMPGLNRADDDFQWAFLILGNLFGGILFAWVLNKANANSPASGATTGAILGLLMALAFDLTMYGVSHIFTTMTGLVIDVLVMTVIGLIVGVVIGWWYGRGRRAILA